MRIRVLNYSNYVKFQSEMARIFLRNSNIYLQTKKILNNIMTSIVITFTYNPICLKTIKISQNNYNECIIIFSDVKYNIYPNKNLFFKK